MPANTYSDGFPLTPLEAIEFSYFLSESEKQEWREWLQTATMEQQNELVDILHSMWQDNQKQAVPAAFANAPAQPAPAPATPVQTPAQQPVQNFPDTSFTNEVFQQPPVQPVPAATPQFQNQSVQPILDTGFAADTSFSNDQFQFVTEPVAPVVNTPALQPQPIATTPVTAPAPVAQPEPQQDLNFTFVEPQDEVIPQFQDSFQSPDLSVPQVQQSQPAPAVQPTTHQPPRQRSNNPQPQPAKPIVEENEEDDDVFEDEHPLSQPILDESGEGQEVALKKMANTKYKPNPILEDKTPPLEEFVYKNGANNSNSKQNDKQDNNQSKREPRENREPREQREPRDNNNKNNNNEPRENREPREQKNKQQPVTEDKKKAFFGSSELREASSKSLLDEVYKAYQDSRTKNAQSSKDLDDKFLGLLDKVMQVISTSGQLADYYETIIEKIIEVNDRVVDQAKEIQLLKNSTQSRGGVSLQDQVDEMRDDIERLNRDTRTMRIEQRKKYDEITAQLASSEADAFNKDGLVHRIDLLKSDIIQIQQQLNINSRPTENPRNDQQRQQNQGQNQQQRRQNPNIQLPKPQAPNFDRDTL
jgi:hypothetical protein